MSTVRERSFIAAGWCSFALGFVGIFLPLLPTTVFWILAAWLWSKGNPALAERIYQHPRFGEPTKQFMEHGIISRKGKLLATIGITTSFAILLLVTQFSVLLYLSIAGVLLLVLAWIFTRPIDVRPMSISEKG